jgi:hypothetical protein
MRVAMAVMVAVVKVITLKIITVTRLPRATLNRVALTNMTGRVATYPMTRKLA